MRLRRSFATAQAVDPHGILHRVEDSIPVRGELLKLGIGVPKRTFQKYRHRAGRRGPHDG